MGIGLPDKVVGTRVDALETIGKGGEKPHPDAFGLAGKGCARRLQGEKLGKIIGAHSVTHSMLPGTTMCPVSGVTFAVGERMT